MNKQTNEDETVFTPERKHMSWSELREIIDEALRRDDRLADKLVYIDEGMLHYGVERAAQIKEAIHTYDDPNPSTFWLRATFYEECPLEEKQCKRCKRYIGLPETIEYCQYCTRILAIDAEYDPESDTCPSDHAAYDPDAIDDPVNWPRIRELIAADNARRRTRNAQGHSKIVSLPKNTHLTWGELHEFIGNAIEANDFQRDTRAHIVGHNLDDPDKSYFCEPSQVERSLDGFDLWVRADFLTCLLYTSPSPRD